MCWLLTCPRPFHQSGPTGVNFSAVGGGGGRCPPPAGGAGEPGRRGPTGVQAGAMPIRWDASRSALASIAEAVGRPPLVRLNRVTADVGPEVFLKLEWYGPTGSLKDRIYLHMFERAEARGELARGMRVLECSTGNAGIACAFVAGVKGYKCTIVMPEGMSDERKKIMRAYGADLVFKIGRASCRE